MSNASYYGNKYYSYEYYVIPNLKRALSLISDALNKCNQLSTSVSKGISVDTDSSLENYITDLRTSLTASYNYLNSALSNANYRKNYLYYYWREALKEGN